MNAFPCSASNGARFVFVLRDLCVLVLTQSAPVLWDKSSIEALLDPLSGICLLRIISGPNRISFDDLEAFRKMESV